MYFNVSSINLKEIKLKIPRTSLQDCQTIKLSDYIEQKY